jgi:hypothetical protein
VDRRARRAHQFTGTARSRASVAASEALPGAASVEATSFDEAKAT